MDENQNSLDADSEHDEDGASEEIPICPECAVPVSKLDYYCPHCGAACGQLTPTLPFVCIPYEVSFYARLWRRVWNPNTGWPMKIVGWLAILLFMPIMLIALPFKWLDRSRPATTSEINDTEE